MSRNIFQYVGEKIVEMITSLVLLATLTFLLLKFLPGAPFDEERPLHPAVQEQLAHHWQLNESWYVQAGSYLSSLGRGDLGVSMARPERTVTEIIAQSAKNTLILNLLSLGVVLAGSFLIALLSMRWRHTAAEEFLDQSIVALVALPSLFWGPLLIYFLGFKLDVLPVALLTTPAHYVLPVLTLSVRPMASLTRLLKDSLISNERFDYVRTAKAKGLSSWHVLTHHILRNSLIPYLSYVGPLMVSVLSGSVLVEMLFAIPGMGTEFLSALNDRDYTLIAGFTCVYGFVLIFVNSLVDIAVRWVDPRLRDGA